MQLYFKSNIRPEALGDSKHLTRQQLITVSTIVITYGV